MMIHEVSGYGAVIDILGASWVSALIAAPWLRYLAIGCGWRAVLHEVGGVVRRGLLPGDQAPVSTQCVDRLYLGDGRGMDALYRDRYLYMVGYHGVDRGQGYP